jgi:hypothetical protein
MSDLQKAAEQALAVLESWQKPFGPFFHLEEWPITWTEHGSVTITLIPRLLKNRQRSGQLQSVEMNLGQEHNKVIDRLRAALAAKSLSTQAKPDKPQITHAEGCWSWGPAHYMCALDEIAKLKGYK